jgi:hypothetical protein
LPRAAALRCIGDLKERLPYRRRHLGIVGQSTRGVAEVAVLARHAAATSATAVPDTVMRVAAAKVLGNNGGQ